MSCTVNIKYFFSCTVINDKVLGFWTVDWTEEAIVKTFLELWEIMMNIFHDFNVL